jgi:hypothetical protein
MVFLVHLLEKCDPAHIKTIENSKLQRQFGVIYEKLMETTNMEITFQANAATSNEFLEFEVERGYYCLKNGWVAHAIDVCHEFDSRTEANEVYYHDLIYSIGCCICQRFNEKNDEDACSIFLQFIITNKEYSKDAR